MRVIYKHTRLNQILKKDKRLETGLGNYFIKEGKKPLLNKIMLFSNKENTHHTLLINEHTKILDLHKTIEQIGMGKQYESIFKIPYESLEEFGDKFNHLLNDVLYRRLCSFDSIDFYRKILFKLVEVSGENLITKKKGTIRLNKFIPANVFDDYYVDVEDFHETNCNAFLVYKVKKDDMKPHAFLFKTASEGKVVYIRIKEYMSEMKKLLSPFISSQVKILP